MRVALVTPRMFAVFPTNADAVELYTRRTVMPTQAQFETRVQAPNHPDTVSYLSEITLPASGSTYFVGVYSPSSSQGLGASRPMLSRLMSLAAPFSVRVSVPPPTITVINPTIPGPTEGGHIVSIIGANFGSLSQLANTTIGFGDSECGQVYCVGRMDYAVLRHVGQPYVFSAGQVTCIIPPGDGTGIDIKVTHYGVESNTFPYSYARPELSSLSVSSGGVTVSCRCDRCV